MINTSKFAERLQKVIDYYVMTASAFADELGVQRSSISHLLSERNKPSLDFILKMEESFPELDLYWLAKGEGDFPPTSKTTENKPNISQNKDLFSDIEPESPKTETKVPEIPQKSIPVSDKELDKIVFFYSDGTFEVYVNP